MGLNPGESLYPEAFYQQVKQVLENFFDFPYLNRHPLARLVTLPRARVSETDGQRLRRAFLAAIEALRPEDSAGRMPAGILPAGRAPASGHLPQERYYRLLRLRYLDANTMQEVARVLGISERQAYRDLKRAEEGLAGLLWSEFGGPAGEVEPAAPPEPAPAPKTEADSPTGVEPGAVEELQGLNLQPANVDLADLLRSAHKAVERLAAERAVELDIALPGSSIQIYADPSLAQQVLTSILSSLVQHGRAHRVIIRAESSAASLHLRFAFDQAGPQPYTTPNSLLMNTLLARLDWQITLEQAAGESALSLTIPLQQSLLLVIDDNNALIELLRRYLTQTRCQVVGADNGQQGLEMAHSLRPDAILLDVMMPTIDGWEVLQRLRVNPATQPIPVIVCSIFNDPELARSLGATHTLAKPVNRAELLALLGQLRLV